MSDRTRDYLGDGVYVRLQNRMIVLTVENGQEVTETIYLEPEVFQALENWVERMKGEHERQAD